VEILRNAGFVFEARQADVDESLRVGEGPEAMVRRLAEAKARAVAAQVNGEAVVIGADTTVALDGRIYGKPVTPEEAAAMFRHYAGRTHDVLTGLAVLRAPQAIVRVECETTRVAFAEMTEREIAEYVATGEPFDKAGAYAIQGVGGRWVTRVEGCYFNVMGLPLARLYRILRELGCVA
jgi:septum formation protein